MFVSYHINFAQLNPMSAATHLLQTMKNVISESHMTFKHISMRLLNRSSGPHSSHMILYQSVRRMLGISCAVIDHALFYLRHVTAYNYM
jgi:hypothetical protein